MPFVCKAQSSNLSQNKSENVVNENSVNNDNDKFTEHELRIILRQLKAYEVSLKELSSCTDRLNKELLLDATEKVHFEELLSLEKERTNLSKAETKITERERDLAQDKANFYEAAYKQVMKKPPLWCRIVRNIPVVGWFTSCH